jgi:bifunctional UDP-N-acetylglucosamine pyrophosphorylase/glucosamine-1-phosphate N-acetyltransferase
MAAGRGKRLRPYTDQVPKPLLAVNGLPMLESVFLALREAKVSQVCIVVHHLAPKIKAFASNGQTWGLKIVYAHQEALLGTADAIRTASHFITEPCYILAADYALPRHYITDFRDAYLAQSSPLFVSLKELSPTEISQKSSVRLDENGRITEIVEKPAPGQAPSTIGAAPFLIVPPQIVQYLSIPILSTRGEFELTDVLNKMIQDGFSMSGFLQPEPEEWQLPKIYFS